MRIGIDISQIVHEGTGVATYVTHIVRALVDSDSKNEYVLFGASLRKRAVFSQFVNTLKRPVRLVVVPIPPTVLDILWNVLHMVPVEWFVGRVDVFWSSDWTQPPLRHARGITTIHDLTILRFPESFAKKIVTVQKRKLDRSLKICDLFLCDSKATQKDVIELLHVKAQKTQVVYPGFTL
jgi:hypothetical protein